MRGIELIINFEHDKAFLTEDRVLSLQQLGLPDNKPFKSPASWTVKVLRHFPTEKRIFAEIVSYKSDRQPFPSHQLSLDKRLKDIDKITFKSIDTFALLRTREGGSQGQTYFPQIEGPVRKERPQTSQPTSKPEPLITTIRETFLVPLKNVRFKFGCVSFERRVPKLDRTIEFVVANEALREEFDAVKNYFGNVLKTKKIRFDTKIQITAGEVTVIETTSPEISRIDQTLIDSVKFEFVKSMTKKKLQPDIDKSLFTMDEFFDTLSEEPIKANIFYDNENQLIEDLLQITNTKHYKHLRFLSSKHAHSIMKLRFVLKPFSFIFLIEGQRYYHIIWETLDTAEATYIWHEDKDLKNLKLALRKVDNIINTIKVQGKTAYMNTTEDNFRRIYHDYSDLVDGFVKWKGELESVIT